MASLSREDTEEACELPALLPPAAAIFTEVGQFGHR